MKPPSRLRLHARKGERPLEDYEVDRPEVYGEKSLKLTGTNGQSLDHIYDGLSGPIDRPFEHSHGSQRFEYPRNLFLIFFGGGERPLFDQHVYRSSPLTKRGLRTPKGIRESCWCSYGRTNT